MYSTNLVGKKMNINVLNMDETVKPGDFIITEKIYLTSITHLSISLGSSLEQLLDWLLGFASLRMLIVMKIFS